MHCAVLEMVEGKSIMAVYYGR